MCVVTTVSFMFFLRATGAAPRSCFSLLCELGDSTHDRGHCVRDVRGVHDSPLLNQICKASYTVHK